ncbi:MAG: coproporphyrinogen dehydrogenase HemZ [Clostridia bacterium]|nr:coproporphyrinogen dehydrogenase HemZ [Clostridia bacterium]
MLLTIHGELNKYYLQTLCMLFYPGAKFADDETDTAQSATFVRRDTTDGVEVICTFENHGETASASRFIAAGATHGLDANSHTDPMEKAAKIAAGIAALEAGKELFGTVPSWGILTGIRPAKMASELLCAHAPDGTRLHSPADTRNILTDEYFVNPRKAALAVDIAKNEQKIARLARQGRMPTCSIYISVPFCPTRCAYCSFVSYTSRRLLALIPDYLERLCRDLAATLRYIKARGFRLMTVYIGGGTPTTLDERGLERLLRTLFEMVDVGRLHEFTLEGGRPDTITAGKLETARRFGVTRMSINPQTMNNDILQSIGRRHTVEDFYRAYTLAKNAGIKVINTDLIAGLPGDDFAGFSRSVDRILALDPENITVHTFCVKKSAEILKIDTEIYNRSADETVKGIDYSQVRLKNAGYMPYYIYRQKNTVGNLENVGFAKKGTESLYNVLMMEELHTIFAVGAGAVTKLVRIDDGGKKHIERVFEPKYPYEYLAADEEASRREKEAQMDAFFGFET